MPIANPIVNAPNLYMNGLNMSWSSNYVITIADGACRDSTNVNDIILNTGTVGYTIVNSQLQGNHGLDVGTLAIYTLYAVYVLGDSTNPSASGACMSLSFVKPTLPDGFDMYRRVGAFATTGDPYIYTFWQEGRNDTARKMYYDTFLTLTFDQTGTGNNIVQSINNAAPEAMTDITVQVNWTADSAGDSIYVAPDGTAGNGIDISYAQAAGTIVQNLTTPVGISNSIVWNLTSGDQLNTMSLVSYVDLL